MLGKILERVGMAKKKTVKKAAKKTAKKTVKKTAKKVAKKAANPPAKKVDKKSTKKITKNSAKKTVKKAPAAVAKKAVKKVAAKVAKKTTKKGAKKTAKKAEAKALGGARPASTVAKKRAAKASKKTESVLSVIEGGPTKVEVVQEAAIHLDPEAQKAQNVKSVGGEDEAGKMKAGKKGTSENLEDKNIKAEVSSLRNAINKEIVLLTEEYSLMDIFNSFKTLEHFNKDIDECIEKGCDNPATSMGYCRYHYIRSWKEIKRKEAILLEGKLQMYVKELVEKYPVKYIEGILTDLEDEKSFFNILRELNIETEDAEFDGENEEGDDDQDIAFETKVIQKPSFDE